MVDREKEIKEFTNDPNRPWTQTIEIELPVLPDSPKSISLEIEEIICDKARSVQIHKKLKVIDFFILSNEFVKGKYFEVIL